MKEKKKWNQPRRDLNLHPDFLHGRSAPSDHSVMRPLQQLTLEINTLKVAFSAIHTVGTLWSCIYHEFKDTFEEK